MPSPSPFVVGVIVAQVAAIAIVVPAIALDLRHTALYLFGFALDYPFNVLQQLIFRIPCIDGHDTLTNIVEQLPVEAALKLDNLCAQQSCASM